jgi:hypothetical protein
MGFLNDCKDNLRVTCTMPMSLYKQLKCEVIELLSIYDTSLYSHFKKDKEWQDIQELYKEISEKKKDIEFSIKWKLYNNK